MIKLIIYYCTLYTWIAAAAQPFHSIGFMTTTYRLLLYMLSNRSFALSFASSLTLGLLIVALRPPALHRYISQYHECTAEGGNPLPCGKTRERLYTHTLFGFLSSLGRVCMSPPLYSLSRTSRECCFDSSEVLGFEMLALWPPMTLPALLDMVADGRVGVVGWWLSKLGG